MREVPTFRWIHFKLFNICCAPFFLKPSWDQSSEWNVKVVSLCYEQKWLMSRYNSGPRTKRTKCEYSSVDFRFTWSGPVVFVNEFSVFRLRPLEVHSYIEPPPSICSAPRPQKLPASLYIYLSLDWGSQNAMIWLVCSAVCLFICHTCLFGNGCSYCHKI